MAEITRMQGSAHVRHGSNVGQPLTRRDGVLKVTGAAKYAADNHPPGLLYAVLLIAAMVLMPTGIVGALTHLPRLTGEAGRGKASQET